MTDWSRESLREVAMGTALGIVVVVLLVSGGTPSWLRGAAGVVACLAAAAPLLPILVLVPWHFLAIHRGLTPRRTEPSAVFIRDGWVVRTGPRDGETIRIRLGAIRRARVARNDNWTASKMLDDAIGLFGSSGRELLRIPLGSQGSDDLLAVLARDGVPTEEVAVSAPAVLD
jgi:hypothetical protein